ncbi:SirB2 family protein [Azonexus sp.]|uniref:SirB2 family protein n=1 Tax=Azonexus sp. TaxID=1872668 RepID=UPI0039E60936
MNYLLLKQIHITCVVLSGLGFALRFFWMLRSSPYLQARLTRMIPHLVDSTLFFTALAMVWMSGQYPFVHSWLTAKVLALLLYIILGAMALKRGRTREQRFKFGLLAALTFAYIVGVALSRQASLGLF